MNYLDDVNVFDTDLNNSVFNQVSIEEAHNKGATFFEEYLKFHKLQKAKQELIPVKKPKPFLNLPEFNFKFV